MAIRQEKPVINRFLFVFSLFLIFPISRTVLANPQNLTIVGVSSVTLTAGTNISVTVSFCDDTAWASNRVALLAAFLPGTQTNISSCSPPPPEYFVVSSKVNGTGGIATGPGMYDLGNGGSTRGEKGGPPYYPSYTNNGTPSCPADAVTAVWSIYIDGTYLIPGTYSLVVLAQEDDVTCGGSSAQAFINNLIVPLPATACTVSKTSGVSAVEPGGLVLFNISYSYVNTTSFILNDSLPSGLTPVSYSTGGAFSGNNVSWNLYNGAATTQQSGVAWVLAQVDSNASNGTVYSNNAVGTAVGAVSGPVTSNTVTSTVQYPQLGVFKSESASVLANASSVTYSLNWYTIGASLQLYDTYYNEIGMTNGSITGFDGTTYTQYAAQDGDLGAWQVAGSLGNEYIVGTTQHVNANGTDPDYPALIRTGPGVNICSGFTVQGDLQIPTSAGSYATNGDCAMVVAINASQGVTMAAAISGNNVPAYFYFQKNQNYSTTTLYSSTTGHPMGSDSSPLISYRW